jgi:acyl carrier protein
MGLDAVELVMAVEEEFKVDLPAEEAVQCETVGKLVDLVHSKVRQSAADPCLSQRGFYVVRKTLMGVLGLERSRITPESVLENLIPRDDRVTVWRKVFQSLQGDSAVAPTLICPRWMKWMTSLVIPGTVCVLITALTWLPFIAAFLIAVVAGLLTGLTTIPFRIEFPASCSRVKDLVRYVGSLDPRVWSKETVFVKLREIIVEQLGVKESQVTLEAHFVNDLLMD